MKAYSVRLNRFALGALEMCPVYEQKINNRIAQQVVTFRASPAKLLIASLHAFATRDFLLRDDLPYPILPQKKGAVISQLPARINYGLIEALLWSARDNAQRDGDEYEALCLKNLTVSEFLSACLFRYLYANHPPDPSDLRVTVLPSAQETETAIRTYIEESL